MIIRNQYKKIKMSKGTWNRELKHSAGKSTGVSQLTLICLMCMSTVKRKNFKDHWKTHKGKKYKVIIIYGVFYGFFLGILIHFYSRINRVKITIWVAKAIIIRLSWTLLVDHWTPLPPQQRSTPGFNSFWTVWLLMPPPSII